MGNRFWCSDWRQDLTVHNACVQGASPLWKCALLLQLLTIRLINKLAVTVCNLMLESAVCCAGNHPRAVNFLAVCGQFCIRNRRIPARPGKRPCRAGAYQDAIHVADITNASGCKRQFGLVWLPTKSLAGSTQCLTAYHDIRAGILVRAWRIACVSCRLECKYGNHCKQH